MNTLFKEIRSTVAIHVQASAKWLFGVVAVGAILATVACSESGQSVVELNVDSVLGQAVFAEPKDAANALVGAIANRDTSRLGKLLGIDYRDVLPLDNIDSEDVDGFVAAFDERNILLPLGEQKKLIAVGEDEWTFPIPIVSGATGWYFDVEEGRERMLIRRIGKNELATMQAVMAYFDAQMEYAEEDRNGNGLLEYAQQIISSPNAKDGLYWDTESGDVASPLGPLMADREPGSGYHGYFYRVLRAQGEHAKGGAYSYMMGDGMRAGFALIAWPDDYGDSGVMSFLVSHNGIVYEQNLGPDGADVATAMSAYNPDENWVPVKEISAP